MFQVLNHEEFVGNTALSHGVYHDRAKQFVHRHHWPLRVTEHGHEIDDFDVSGTDYLIVHNREEHRASLRLRPATGGSMVERAFPTMWQDHKSTLRDMTEVTRLCCAPGLAGFDQRLATVELLIGLCRHGRASGQSDLFGIVYPGVARAIARDGWQAECLGVYEIDGRDTWLARWDCTSEADWRLQERAAMLMQRHAFKEAA